MTDVEIEKMREVIMSAVLAMSHEQRTLLRDFINQLKRGAENEQ